MFWRFEELPGQVGKAPLIFDDVRHLLLDEDATWVRVPHYPALTLSLLLRMQSQGYTVSAREICAFLMLPPGSRVSGHISELRKRLDACGVDSERVIEPNDSKAGYRLAAGVRAVKLSEAEVKELIERVLTEPQKVEPSKGAPRVRWQEMLLLFTVFALAFGAWAALEPGGDDPVAQLDPKYRRGADLPYRACFELPGELALRERDVIVLEISRLSASATSRIVVGVERERREDGAASLPFELGTGPTSTVRIAARDLDADLRTHARRICIGEQEEGRRRAGSVRIALQAIRIE